MSQAEFVKKARDAAGGTLALARAVGLAPAQVSQWMSGTRQVPLRYAAAIEQASGGAVTRRELFPDCWQFVWPELATPDASAAEGLAPEPTGQANTAPAD